MSRHTKKGGAIIEFAIVLPLLLLLIFAVDNYQKGFEKETQTLTSMSYQIIVGSMGK